MIMVDAIRDYAYTKPGAVLSSVSTDECGHEFYGIQRDSKNGPAWFAGAFLDEAARFHALYFSHDPATAEHLYQQHPQLKLAEAPLKNRSKIYVDDNTNLPALLSFIDLSYEIVLGKMTKKLQAQIKSIAHQPNAFPYFRQMTEELLWSDSNWLVQMINGWGFTSIYYQLPKRSLYVGNFAHNQLWIESTAIAADRRHEWKDQILAHRDRLATGGK
jgi:hypothetical protein